MDKMGGQDKPTQPVSAFRLRLGVIFFVLFWMPFWLLSPFIATIAGEGNNSQATHRITVLVIIAQTIFGILAFLIAGKEVVKVLRHTKYKKAPGVIWQLLIRGSIDSEQPVTK